MSDYEQGAWEWFCWRVASGLARVFAKRGEFGPRFFGRSVRFDVGER